MHETFTNCITLNRTIPGPPPSNHCKDSRSTGDLVEDILSNVSLSGMSPLWNMFYQTNANWSMGNKTFGQYIEDANLNLNLLEEKSGRNLIDTTLSHRLITTVSERFGWGPNPAPKDWLQGRWVDLLQGDLICVLAGYSKPVIIRPLRDGYQLVGDVYIQGMMDGEGL
ncbi:hypothetical protein NHQ30_005026 [Ciborinia camelliae]|nr:hypothetical protein NHQ30_005026 [Ciborinia camelliae]